MYEMCILKLFYILSQLIIIITTKTLGKTRTFLTKMKNKKSKQKPKRSRKNESKAYQKEYLCGQENCAKVYHAYSSFYIHCKNSHPNCTFPPQNSLLNGQVYVGPMMNRGRPATNRINFQTRCDKERNIIKSQNQLVEYLGTIDKIEDQPSQLEQGKKKQLVTVTFGFQKRLDKAIKKLKEVFSNKLDIATFLNEFNHAQSIIAQNDLPQFYDPADFHSFQACLDSSDLRNIFEFFRKNKIKSKGQVLLGCWLSRFLNQDYLFELLYVLAHLSLSSQCMQSMAIKHTFIYINTDKKYNQIVQLVNNLLKQLQIGSENQTE